MLSRSSVSQDRHVIYDALLKAGSSVGVSMKHFQRPERQLIWSWRISKGRSVKWYGHGALPKAEASSYMTMTHFQRQKCQVIWPWHISKGRSVKWYDHGALPKAEALIWQWHTSKGRSAKWYDHDALPKAESSIDMTMTHCQRQKRQLIWPWRTSKGRNVMWYCHEACGLVSGFGLAPTHIYNCTYSHQSCNRVVSPDDGQVIPETWRDYEHQ
jgi:hypothetical protein